MKQKVIIYGILMLSGAILVSCGQMGSRGSGSGTAMDENSLEGVSFSADESRIIWNGTSVGVYTHTGTVNFSDLDIKIKEGKIAGGSFTVDLTSMVSTDNNFNPEEGYTSEKLLGHLSSADFFDVATYPTATFVMSSVTENSATGILTIRGISHEETVSNITTIREDGKVKVTGDLVFDRKKYDVSWDYPGTDMLLKKEIELNIELVGS